MPPPQPRKPPEVAIGGDPLAAGFDRECCEVGVRHEVARGAAGPQDVDKDVPVSGAGRNYNAIFAASQAFHERQRVIDRRRRPQGSGIRSYAKEATANQFSKAKRFAAVSRLQQPFTISVVIG